MMKTTIVVIWYKNYRFMKCHEQLRIAVVSTCNHYSMGKGNWPIEVEISGMFISIHVGLISAFSFTLMKYWKYNKEFPSISHIERITGFQNNFTPFRTILWRSINDFLHDIRLLMNKKNTLTTRLLSVSDTV